MCEPSNKIAIVCQGMPEPFIISAVDFIYMLMVYIMCLLIHSLTSINAYCFSQIAPSHCFSTIPSPLERQFYHHLLDWIYSSTDIQIKLYCANEMRKHFFKNEGISHNALLNGMFCDGKVILDDDVYSKNDWTH